MSSVRADTAAHRVLQTAAAVLPRQIEIGERPRRVEIGVRVEALHEALGLVPQVVLDLELGLGERVADVVGELQAAAELGADRDGGEIRHVAEHPGHAHAGVRRAPGAVVVAALPVRIGGDGVAGDRVPRDALRLQRVRAGDRDDGVDLAGVGDRPLERLHAAQRAARHGGQPLDAQLVQERALDPHHVGNGDHRKVRPVRPAGGRIGGRRPGGAAAAAEQVRADDEEAVGVEGLAGADHAVPPARARGRLPASRSSARKPSRVLLLGGRRRKARRVRVAAERMADQDDVVARGRQRPVGFVGDPYLGRSVRPQSSGTGSGRSRNCVATVPTEPAAGLTRAVAMTASLAMPAHHKAGGAAPRPAMYDPALCADRRSDGPVFGRLMMENTKANNGVNVDALLAAREVLKGAPQAAKFTWRASCKWKNGTHSETSIQGFHGLGEEQKHKTETSFSADHPEIFASEDLGVTPVEYLLVGLASCLTAGVAAVAQNRGIQLRSVESKVEGKMDIQGILGIDSDVRNGYDDIKITFKIDADASKKEIEALVAQSQKRSAVYDAITNPTNVTVEVAVARRAAAPEFEPSNASPRSSSAPGTPGWRRAAA